MNLVNIRLAAIFLSIIWIVYNQIHDQLVPIYAQKHTDARFTFKMVNYVALKKTVNQKMAVYNNEFTSTCGIMLGKIWQQEAFVQCFFGATLSLKKCQCFLNGMNEFW